MLLACLCLMLCSCEVTTVIGGSREAELITPSPAPVLTNEPAGLFTGVTTDQRVVSLVLEGYTDESSMSALIGMIRERGIPCVWFVSGITAFENGSIVRDAALAGIELGNYTVSAEKEMENRSGSYLVHQFDRTQELILKNAFVKPSLARCNGTVYTREVLQAVAAAGLNHAVDPTLYLNHRSFRAESDAALYMKSLIRGSIISIKLGQELDQKEYGEQGDPLDERPAVDPSPSISDDMIMQDASQQYQNITKVTEWLLDALQSSGYRIVSLEELQAAAIPDMGSPRELTAEEEALLNPAAYPGLVTDGPVGQSAVTQGSLSDLSGAVLVGDSVTRGLAEYAAWRRQTEPDYLADTHFLTWNSMTVESAMAAMDEGAVLTGDQLNLAQAIRELGASRVYLMLQFDTTRACHQEKYLVSLRTLIHRIRQENPDVQIIVQSVLPGITGRIGSPTNEELFRYNLLLARMCLQYDIPYVDVASALRDADGALKPEYCIDPQLYGTHLSDEGCQAWIDYLTRNIPQ